MALGNAAILDSGCASSLAPRRVRELREPVREVALGNDPAAVEDDISKVDRSEYRPDDALDLYLSESQTGANDTRTWPQPQEWAELVEQATTHESPKTLLAEDYRYLLMPLLVAYPPFQCRAGRTGQKHGQLAPQDVTPRSVSTHVSHAPHESLSLNGPLVDRERDARALVMARHHRDVRVEGMLFRQIQQKAIVLDRQLPPPWFAAPSKGINSSLKTARSEILRCAEALVIREQEQCDGLH